MLIWLRSWLNILIKYLKAQNELGRGSWYFAMALLGVGSNKATLAYSCPTLLMPA